MRHQNLSMILALAGAVVVLTGCSGDQGLKALDRPATDRDTLPSGVVVMGGADQTMTDSFRLLAEKDGYSYYVGQNVKERVSCLAVVPAADQLAWASVCGDLSQGDHILGLGLDNGRLNVRLVGDQADTKKLESEGATRIHQNIYR
jgi:hypothetical protein